MTIKQLLSRRKFLESSAVALGSISLGSALQQKSYAEANENPVIAGAIRWDAWYKRADASLSAQYNLSTPKYSGRAPFFCSLSPAADVSCVGSPDEMEVEIHQAAEAGLSYWAFDWYAMDSSLRTAWTLYSQSPSRNLVKWCGIVELASLGSLPFTSNKWQSNVQEWTGYMRQSNYQKVRIDGIDRPLLYVIWDKSQLKYYFDDNLSNLRGFLSLLTKSLRDSAIGAPYVAVFMPTEEASAVLQMGADAISSYTSGFQRKVRAPYVDLEKQTESFWERMQKTTVPIIPIVMVGWDTRARQERPVPWSHNKPNPNPTEYYEIATPREFATHLQNAVNFVTSHSTSCPSKALLIYSWDECDEGGGLVPSIRDPNGSYISAAASILKQ